MSKLAPAKAFATNYLNEIICQKSSEIEKLTEKLNSLSNDLSVSGPLYNRMKSFKETRIDSMDELIDSFGTSINLQVKQVLQDFIAGCHLLTQNSNCF
jgi:uncharacterized coiled-coil protein SlyX